MKVAIINISAMKWQEVKEVPDELTLADLETYIALDVAKSLPDGFHVNCRIMDTGELDENTGN